MGTLMVVLKPWKERTKKGQSVFALIDSVNTIAAKYQEAVTFSVNPSSIPGLGMSSGLEMMVLDINNHGAAELKKAIESIREAVKDEPKIKSITSLFQGTVPQYSLNIDRDKAKLQGLEMSDIFSTLSAYMGGNYVNDFNDFGRVYQVTLMGDDSARGNIEDVIKLSVRNSAGAMVPFSAFTTIEPTMGEPTSSRYNMYGCCIPHSQSRRRSKLKRRYKSYGKSIHAHIGEQLFIRMDRRSVSRNPIWHHHFGCIHIRDNNDSPRPCGSI